MSDFKRGHCLNCDLVAVLNAYLKDEAVTPTDLMETMTSLMADTIVMSAEDGREKTLLQLVVSMIAMKTGTLVRQRDEAANTDKTQSFHAPGHA